MKDQKKKWLKESNIEVDCEDIIIDSLDDLVIRPTHIS